MIVAGDSNKFFAFGRRSAADRWVLSLHKITRSGKSVGDCDVTQVAQKASRHGMKVEQPFVIRP